MKSNKSLFYFIGAMTFVLILLYLQIHKVRNAVENEVEVWAYGSFYSDYGPGRELAAAFKKKSGLQIIFNRIEDPGLFLKRLQVIPDQRADVVINFDQWNIDEAIKELEPLPLESGSIPWRNEIRGFVKENAVPMDWAPMTWIHRKGSGATPKDWDELLSMSSWQKKITLMNPITSSPGWLWLFWLSQNHNDFQKNLQQLKAQAYSLSPDWSDSYGLFQNGKADLTFSYVTSLIYHWREEKSDLYEAAIFSQGHPMQVEFIVVPKRSRNLKGAQAFAQFLLSSEAQALIRDKNFMFSVREDLAPTEFEKRLPELKVLPPEKHNEFIQNKAKWLEQLQKTWF